MLEISRAKARQGRPHEKGITREGIVNAAKEVFSEKGFHYTKMEDIAARAKCGAGTLYNYFTSKEVLYITVIDESFNNLFTIINSIIMKDADFTEKLEETAKVAIGFADNNRSFSKLLFSQMGYLTSELIGSFADRGQIWFRQFVDLYSKIMFQGIREGNLRELNPADLAHLFLGIQHQLFNEWLLSPVNYKLESRIPMFLDLFLYGAGNNARGGK